MSHAQLLEHMCAATIRLRQARGDWDRPSADRLWNAVPEPEAARPPLALKSYRCVRVF